MSMAPFSLFVALGACLVFADELTDNESLDFDVDDVCLSEFHVEKYTMASSDSYRDTEMVSLIFPEAEAEYAPHFKQDYCARQSKISLPYSCFKIHGPQTDQHDQGYLHVKTLENEFSKKFYAVINGYSSFQFDAFFDYSLGFWVKHLDKYLKRIDENHEILTHYIGLKWYSPEPVDKTFYSLIIQSPGSQKVFELMSFNQPDLSKYKNLRKNFKFTHINEQRATFLSYPISEGEFPWIREDDGGIVPIQISFGCSNIREHVEFYTKVMEAKLLYLQNDLTSNIDDHTVHYAFMQPVNDRMVIKYVQRPIDYTYGAFTTEEYKNLLVDTHNDRITSPVCGLDRWFDNHYGYNTLKFAADSVHYNYMDRVLNRLLERQLKWRLYHTPYEDESPEGKYWMKKFGFQDVFTLYVFDMNGQTIQMFGEFREHQFPFVAPIYNKQWCYVPCPFHQQMGEFDATQIYQENQDDIVYKVIMDLNKRYDRTTITLEELQTLIANQDEATNEMNEENMDNMDNIDNIDNGDNVINKQNKKRMKKLQTNEKDEENEDEEMEGLIDLEEEIKTEEEVDGSPHGGKGNIYIATIVCITLGVIGCILIMCCAYKCIMKQRRTGDHSQFESPMYHAETTSLLHHKRRA